MALLASISHLLREVDGQSQSPLSREAVRGVADAAASGGQEDAEAAAGLIAQSAALVAMLRGERGPELCESALAAVAVLLSALAGAALPPSWNEGGNLSAPEGLGQDGVASGRSTTKTLKDLREAAKPANRRAVETAWEAVGPLILTQIEASRWSLRYHAAWCVLIREALLSLTSSVGDGLPPRTRTEQLLRVARLSQDSRSHLKELALHAAAAALLAYSCSGCPGGAKRDTKTRLMCSVVWVHAAQCADDTAPGVAHAAHQLLDAGGYPAPNADAMGAEVGVTRGEQIRDGEIDSDDRNLHKTGVLLLGTVGVWGILPELGRSLGLLSPSHHCGVTWGQPHEEEQDDEHEDDEEAWLRRELERQGVLARLKGISAVLVTLQQFDAVTPTQEWGLRQEVALLAELSMAPGMRAIFMVNLKIHSQLLILIFHVHSQPLINHGHLLILIWMSMAPAKSAMLRAND